MKGAAPPTTSAANCHRTKTRVDEQIPIRQKMNSKGGCIRPQFVAGKGWLHLSAACGWEGVASQQLPRRGGASRQLPRRRRGGSFPAASKAEGFGVDFHILFGLNSVGQNPPKMATWRHFWSDPVVPPTMASPWLEHTFPVAAELSPTTSQSAIVHDGGGNVP